MSGRVGGSEPIHGRFTPTLPEPSKAECLGTNGSRTVGQEWNGPGNAPQSLKLTTAGVPPVPTIKVPCSGSSARPLAQQLAEAPGVRQSKAPTGRQVIDAERAKADAEIPGRSSLHQRFDRLDHPDSFRDLVDGIVLLRRRLPKLREPEQVGMAVRGCTDRFLRAEKVPELTGDVTADPSQKEMARFDPKTWSVSLRSMPKTLDRKQAATLANSLAHEARHAEQVFHGLTGMFRGVLEKQKAGWEEKGLWPPGESGVDAILESARSAGQADVPPEVAKKAIRAAIEEIDMGAGPSRSRSLLTETPKGYRMGAASEEVRNALAAYETARSGLEDAASRGSSAKAKAKAALEQARKELGSTYARMRADRFEGEAYQTGKLAERAVMAHE